MDPNSRATGPPPHKQFRGNQHHRFPRHYSNWRYPAQAQNFSSDINIGNSAGSFQYGVLPTPPMQQGSPQGYGFRPQQLLPSPRGRGYGGYGGYGNQQYYPQQRDRFHGYGRRPRQPRGGRYHRGGGQGYGRGYQHQHRPQRYDDRTSDNDPFYNLSMFEDPWKELLQKNTTESIENKTEVQSSDPKVTHPPQEVSESTEQCDSTLNYSAERSESSESTSQCLAVETGDSNEQDCESTAPISSTEFQSNSTNTVSERDCISKNMNETSADSDVNASGLSSDKEIESDPGQIVADNVVPMETTLASKDADVQLKKVCKEKESSDGSGDEARREDT